MLAIGYIIIADIFTLVLHCLRISSKYGAACLKK